MIPPVQNMFAKDLHLANTPEAITLRKYLPVDYLKHYNLAWFVSRMGRPAIHYNDHVNSIISNAESAFSLEVLELCAKDMEITSVTHNQYQLEVLDRKGLSNSNGHVNIKFFAILFILRKGEKVDPALLPFEYEHVDFIETTDAIERLKMDRQNYATHKMWLQISKDMILA